MEHLKDRVELFLCRNYVALKTLEGWRCCLSFDLNTMLTISILVLLDGAGGVFNN